MKKQIFTIIMLLFSVGVIAQPASVAPASGDGTSGNPYQISSVENLLWIFDGTVTSPTLVSRMSAYYQQTTDITFPSDLNTWNSNSGWEPIGTETTPFLGNYDGAGNSITDLYINQPTSVGNVGLFGYIGTGTQANPVVIQNVHLIGPQVSGGRGTGSLVGRVVGNIYTLIEGCSAIKDIDGVGTVTGTSATGGLVGANNSIQETPGGTDNPIISKCFSKVDVVGLDDPNETFTQKIGGLVGCNQKGTTRNSYARGTVTIEGTDDFERLGGLAGCTDIRGRIEYSYATGGLYFNDQPISTTNNNGGNLTLFGGLVGNVSAQGQGNNGVVVDSYWDTETSEQPTSPAGTGLLTTEMKIQTNLVGFDFTNVWSFKSGVNDDYAVLQDVVLTQFITWTGNTDSDWEKTSNWSPDTRIPVAADIAVIPDGLINYPVISTAISTPAKEVDVQAGAPGTTSATITITSIGRFTVANTLRTDPPGIIIQSDETGTGSLVHNSSEVYGTIQRYITGAELPGSDDATQYHTVSVPLTQSSNPLSGLFIDSYLYSFNADNQDWFAYGAPVDTPLDVDQGYLIYYPENTPRTYTFTGTLNNGEFSAAVKQVGTATKTLNLVPNPYPSAIDWDATSGWTKGDFDNAIWIWSPDNGNYATYINSSGTLGATSEIPVGQAFFVRTSDVNTVNPILTMNNDVRLHSNQAFFKNKEQQSNVLRIKALANKYSDEIVVRFREGATNNFDGQFDAGKMFGMGGSPQLYSMSADGQQLSINSIPATTEQVSIPIGFELETNGEVTFVASSIESFAAEMPIFLWDKQADMMIDLRANPQYTFLHDPYDEIMRFDLLLNSAVSVEDIAASSVNILIYYSDSRLNLNIPAEVGDNPMVNVFNTSGQLVYSAAAKTGSSSITLPGISRGIYMVQVTGKNHSATKKVSIN